MRGNQVQSKIARALASGATSSSECDELLKQAEARSAEIRERMRSLQSSGDHLTEEKRRILLTGSPGDLIAADRELLELDAEGRSIFSQSKELRRRRDEARKAEIPPAVEKGIRSLPGLIKKLQRANAVQDEAFAALKTAVTQLQTQRGSLPYAERRKCAGVDDEVFAQLRALLWEYQAPLGTAHGLTSAATRARLSLCVLSDEEEDQLATGDWAGQQQRAALAKA